MKLNADIGEMTGHDEAIVPYITMANIACGYHASNLQHMDETVELTLSAPHPIQIGAHVSYRDRENFGRISIPHSPEEITALIIAQVRDLEKICRHHQTQVDYIKPHGALYHDMMTNPSVRNALCTTAIKLQLPLVVQAQITNAAALTWPSELTVITESFADRAYTDRGALVSRNNPHAVHQTPEKIIAQATQLIKNKVTSENKKPLHLPSDTLCIHGDNPASISALKEIHALLQSP